MGEGLTDEGCGIRHWAHILGWGGRQVNGVAVQLSKLDRNAIFRDSGIETAACGLLEWGTSSAKLYGLLLVGE